MTTTEEILAQLPEHDKLRYRVLLSDKQSLKKPKSYLKPPKLYIQFLRDEDQSTHDRFAARDNYTLNVCEYEFQGELIKVRCNAMIDRPLDSHNHPRKPITTFSKKARKNMLETVSRMDWQAQKAVFITLTYHQPVNDAKRCKAHLRAFLKRIYRGYGKKAVLWRIERQPRRGAWHFHMIVFSLPFFPIDTLLKWWREITGQPTITQCDIQLIGNARKARSYVAKYCGKAEKSRLDYPTNSATENLPGRFWGIENRALITWAQLIRLTVELSKAHFDFKRAAKRLYPAMNSGKRQGFSVFSQDVKGWIDLLWLYIAGIHRH